MEQNKQTNKCKPCAYHEFFYPIMSYEIIDKGLNILTIQH